MDVDVLAGVDVVEEIPAGMIEIVIDHEIFGIAIPAPVGRDRPVPRGDLEVEAAGKPEKMMIAVETLDAITVRRSEVLESAALVRMIEVIAAVIGRVVAVPVVLGNVRGAVDAAAVVPFRFRLGMTVATLRRLGAAALVGARKISSVFAAAVFLRALLRRTLFRASFAGALAKGRSRKGKADDGYREQFVHEFRSFS